MSTYQTQTFFQGVGLHGTTVTRMNQILGTGSFTVWPGRRGPGVYFWKMNAFAERVACNWHDFALKNGRFKGDADTRCGIIRAELQAEEACFLDLNDAQVQDLIVGMAAKAELDKNSSDEEISSFYDLFLDSFEQRAGVSFWVLACPLPLPAAKTFYPFNAIGNPVAYIVRDLRSIVSMQGREASEDPT